MDVLHALALQSTNPNCYVLAEQEISRYLQSPEGSLEKLNEAVDKQAEVSRHRVEFWTTMQEFLSRPSVE